MIERSKEFALAGLLILSASAAAFAETKVDPVAPTVERDEETPATYIDRAMFCAPAPQGFVGAVRPVASSLEGGAIELGFEPSEGETSAVGEGEAVSPPMAPGEPLDVVGFGALPAASTVTNFKSPVKGLGAAACSSVASNEWFFPAGSSANGFDERLVLYNPFPDEAVVRVTFFTEGGELNKASLADVPVPSGDTTTIEVNEFILQRRSLGIKIDALRGRVTAWKTVVAKTEDRPQGVTSTLGAPSTALLWYFPSGAVGEGNDQRISILNPTGKEALVSITLVTDEQTIQPPDLMEVPVARNSELDVKLSSAVGQKIEGPVSVLVRSLNQTGIVVERSTFYGAGEFTGYASEIGATVAAEKWWLGAPGTALDSDALIIYNPGQESAEIDISLSGTGFTDVDQPPTLRLASGQRLRIPLQDLTDGAAAVAHLTASGPVVAERVGYSSALEDVSALMGVPVEQFSRVP